MPSITAGFIGSQAITDDNTVNSNSLFLFPIPTGATVTSIFVGLNITHGFDADLDIRLVAPNSTSIDLSSDNGGAGDNYVGTFFADGAATSITAGAAPFNGVFQPEQPLSTLFASTPNGNWTLQITDDLAGDTGTLTAWGITINYNYSGTVTGTANADVLNGSDFADKMFGGDNNDFLFGLDGPDLLDGGRGADQLFAGPGNDILRGGLGRDTLIGDTGHDIFDYDKVAETGKTAASRDIILDFVHNGDDIDLSTIDANKTLHGNQAFKFIGTNSFHHKAGEVHFQHSGGNTIVSGDVNGDAHADFQIQLTGLINLTKGDFIL